MTARRRVTWTVLVLIAAAGLAGCGGGPAASVPPRHPTALACTTPTAKPAPKPPGLQLPANTSVGTGALAAAWAAAILTALDAPAGTADTRSMVAWFTAEDDHKTAGQRTYGAGENNPLNLTADSGDTVGVTGTEPSGAGPGHPGNLDFRTPDYGTAATAQVIETRYPAISQALQHGDGLIGNQSVSADLARWSGGGYSSLH